MMENNVTWEASLNKLLATVEVVAMNVKGRHWLVAGDAFDSTHILLDRVWKTLLGGADKIAETMRVLAMTPETSSKVWRDRSYIQPDDLLETKRLNNTYLFSEDTRNELNTIVAIVHDVIAEPDMDATFESDLTAFTSELRHHILFLDGMIQNWNYAK